MINKGMMSSNTDNWATPQLFFDELNKEFCFTLDVCANYNNHKCPKYFDDVVDGLKQNWGSDTCFMNPPYGREIGKWVKKAHETSSFFGNTIVGLLPARTDTKWFHDYIYGKAEIRFVRGRLKFGDSKNSAPFPSMVVVWKFKGIF